MKALLSKVTGGPDSLVLEDVEPPVVGPGQLLVRVRAVGVNYPDALIIQDKYQYKPERPFSPGAEVAGEVVQAGEGVQGFVPGDRVVGMCGWGGMVETLAIDAWRCAPVPANMPFDEAAALLMAYGTSWYALHHRAQLRAGETLLVLGAAGGVGLAAVELGKALGANVIAACSSQQKVDVCLAKGADKGLVYPREALDRSAQKALSQAIRTVSGGGVDVIYDAVGGDYAEPALRSLNWEGRFLVVGFPAGIPQIPLNLPLLKSCDIRGVFWGAWMEQFPDQYQRSVIELAELYAAGKIRPQISSRYSLQDAGKGIAELMERQVTGKVVITVD